MKYRNIEYRDIRNKVYDYVYDTLNDCIQVFDVASNVPGYDPDWCADDGSLYPDLKKLMDRCAERITDLLFAYYFD